MTVRKKTIPNMLFWCLGAGLSLIVIGGLFFFFIQTTAGKRCLASALETIISAGIDGSVRIDTIAGFVPFDISVKQVSLLDADGTWLVIDEASLTWSPSALSRGRLVIDTLQASSVHLIRLPHAKNEAAPGNTGSLASLPAQFPSLTIRRFSISTGHIDSTVMGQEAVFSFNGWIQPPQNDALAEGLLEIQRVDGRQGSLVVDYRIDQTTSPTAFTLNAHLVEEENGLLATMLNQQDVSPVSVTVQAGGLTTDWHGTVDAHLPAVGDLVVTVRTLPEIQPALSVDGFVSIAPSLLPASLTTLFAGKIPVDLILSYDPHKAFEIHKANVRLSSGNVQASGALDLTDRTLQGQVTVVADDLSVFEPLIQIPCTGAGLLEATLSGTLTNPETTFQAVLRPARFSAVHTERFESTGHLSFGKSFQDVNITASGSCTNFSLPDAASFPATSFDWNLTTQSAPGGIVKIKNLDLSGDDLSGSLSGTLDIPSVTLAGDAEINIPKTSRFSDLWARVITGSGQLQAHIEAAPATFDAQITAIITEPRVDNAFLVSLLGDHANLSAAVSLVDTKKLAVTAVKLVSKHADLSGDMAINLDTLAMRGTCLLAIPDLSVLATALGQPCSGTATGSAEIRGTWTDPDVTVSVTGAELAIAGASFPSCSASATIADSLINPQGSLATNITFKDSTITGNADYSLQNSRISLSPVTVTTGKNTITGTMTFDLVNNRVHSALEGAFPDISSFASLFDATIAGSAKAVLTLEPGKHGHDCYLSLQGTSLTAPVGEARDVNAHISMQDVFGKPQGGGELVINDFAHNSLIVNSVRLSIKSSKSLWNVDTTLNGKLPDPFDCTARGTVSLAEAHNRFTIDFLEAHYGKERIVLEPPAVITWSPYEHTVERVQLHTGSSGTVTMTGSYRTDYVTANAQLHNLPLSMIPLSEKLGGNVSGALTVAGKPDSPVLAWNFDVPDLVVLQPITQDVEPLSLNVQGTIKADRGDCSLSLTGITEKPVTGALSLPVRLSFAPVTFMVLENLPLEGRLVGAIDLEHFQPRLSDEVNAYNGLVKADIILGGTIKNPELKGALTLEKGSYENTWSGTVLKDVALAMTLHNNTVTLTKAEAVDNRGGTINGSGWLKIDPEQNYPLSVLLVLDNAHLVQRDEIIANAGGRITYTGALDNATLGGKLTLGPTEVLIPDQLPPDVTELTVIEVNRPSDTLGPPVSKKKRAGPEINFDITVSSPGQLFVRGRGLDSEWKGSVHILGTAAVPSVTGTVSVARGAYLLFDKRLTITKGTIIFNGETPPAPTLYMQAEKRQTDLTARVRLAGPLSAPEIVLESEPSYPPDEMLSRLLFGQSARNVSPWQAVQLAQALELLSGTSMGALDFMHHTRRLLHVDRLTLEEAEDEDGGTSVSVGKYIKEGFYVELDKGISEDTDRVSIEIDLTPNISIESTTGTNDEGGLGINWKMDY